MLHYTQQIINSGTFRTSPLYTTVTRCKDCVHAVPACDTEEGRKGLTLEGQLKYLDCKRVRTKQKESKDYSEGAFKNFHETCAYAVAREVLGENETF